MGEEGRIRIDRNLEEEEKAFTHVQANRIRESLYRTPWFRRGYEEDLFHYKMRMNLTWWWCDHVSANALDRWDYELGRRAALPRRVVPTRPRSPSASSMSDSEDDETDQSQPPVTKKPRIERGESSRAAEERNPPSPTYSPVSIVEISDDESNVSINNEPAPVEENPEEEWIEVEVWGDDEDEILVWENPKPAPEFINLEEEDSDEDD